MRKYLQLFKNYQAESWEYRANIVGGIVSELIGIISALIFWLAIYKSNTQIAGYTLNKVIFYYLLMPLIGSITSVWISNKVGSEIKSGFFTNYLIKPNKPILNILTHTFAYKFNYLATTVPVYLIFLIGFSFFSTIRFSGINILMGLLMAISGFFIHCLMDLAISWLGFWVDDVWSFQHFKNFIFAIFGGVAFPFDFLPSSMRLIFELLPFKFFYYIPASYINNQRSFSYLFSDILSLCLWGTLFYLIGIKLYSAGIKKYAAFGY